MKQLIRTLHLWTGLVFGTILVAMGLTGSALAWMHELDTALNPGLLHVAPPAGLADGAALTIAPAAAQAAVARLERDPRYGRPGMIVFPERAGDVFVAWYKPSGAGPAWRMEASRQVMVDPATLQVTGERNWGEPGLSRPLLMPTLFHVHRYLVAGDVGKTVTAITGISLALMTLTGIVLWWPRLTLAALRAALSVRHGGNWPRFSFQLHRSAGFFAAPVLLFMGFSGVQFNMPAWVNPLIGAVAPVTVNAKAANRSDGSARAAPAVALASAGEAFPDARPSRLTLPAKKNQPYEIRMRQPGEARQGDGATRITVDSGDGAVLRVVDPLRARGGDKFISWLFPLHTGEAFGAAGKAFTSFVGLLPLAFFVTGLVVWLKLRRPKKQARRQAQGQLLQA